MRGELVLCCVCGGRCYYVYRIPWSRVPSLPRAGAQVPRWRRGGRCTWREVRLAGPIVSPTNHSPPLFANRGHLPPPTQPIVCGASNRQLNVIVPSPPHPSPPSTLPLAFPPMYFPGSSSFFVGLILFFRWNDYCLYSPKSCIAVLSLFYLFLLYTPLLNRSGINYLNS